MPAQVRTARPASADGLSPFDHCGGWLVVCGSTLRAVVWGSIVRAVLCGSTFWTVLCGWTFRTVLCGSTFRTVLWGSMFRAVVGNEYSAAGGTTALLVAGLAAACGAPVGAAGAGEVAGEGADVVCATCVSLSLVETRPLLVARVSFVITTVFEAARFERFASATSGESWAEATAAKRSSARVVRSIPVFYGNCPSRAEASSLSA